MKRIITAFAAIGLMSAAVLPAFAQQAPLPQQQPSESEAHQQMDPAHQGKGRHGGKHGPRSGARLIDANFDNVIGDDEAASVAEREFMRLDRDRNASLAEAEFTAVPGRGGWWSWGRTQEQGVTDGLKAKFATLDQDKNGAVTKLEFFAEARTRYLAADADKDGKVTPWEFRAQN